MCKNTFKDIKENLKSILFIHQGFELYGSDKSLLRNIQAAGIKYPNSNITVILPQKGILSDILEKNVRIDVRIMPMGVLRKYDLKHMNFSVFYRILRYYKLVNLLNQFDVVFINSIVVIDFILASRHCKSRVLIHVREIPTGIQRFIFCKLLNFSKASILFVSAATKKSFSGLTNKTQLVLLNGCAPVKIISEKKNSKDDGVVNVLLLGRINSWKGQPLLVNAISIIEPEIRKRIRVRILGDVFGNQQYLKRRLMKLIHDKQLDDIIEIIPFTAKPEVHYNWSDVVVVPSLLPEPFGLVAIEAMSAGKLVVAAKHGGLNEIVEEGYTGLFFEPGNEIDLANKLASIIRQPKIIEEFGKNGKEVFKQKFSNEVYSKNFFEII